MESYAVIGGEGFVGAALMRGLAAAYPTAHVSSLGLTQRTFTPSYRFFHTDITSPASLAAAFKNSGATTVFHTASPHPTASKEMCEKVNVEGTQAVVQACWEAGITKLVYTSSVTVCFEGKDIKNADERLPVTKSLDDAYVATKVKAERIVLEANGKQGLLTCSLRLSGIFGPGDRQAIPGIIKVFHAGQTAFQIGNNLNLFDWVHVDNVVHAHILAAKRLDSPPLDVASFTDRLPLSNASITLRTIPTSERTDVSHLPPPPLSNVDSPLPATRNRFHQFHAATPATVGVAGEAFIITNGEPIPFWTFIRAVWYAYNKHVPPFVVPLPMSVGMAAAGVAESWEWMMGREGGDEGLSRNHVRYVGCHMWFNIEKARRVLGYEPIIGLQAGIVDAVEWVKAEEAKSSKSSSK